VKPSKYFANESNVVYVRRSSKEAAKELSSRPLSLIVVDTIHDYINTWFDFRVWHSLLVPGGIILSHDVDDHAGTNLACWRILRQKDYRVWGYCPNSLPLKKWQKPKCQNLSTKLTSDR